MLRKGMLRGGGVGHAPLDSRLRGNDVGGGAGMTGLCGRALPHRPGHTPRACCARTRPFRRGRKGQSGWTFRHLKRLPSQE